MKEYYETELGKLYQGDCLEVMDGLIKEGIKVDAIVTSPPYNIGKMHSNKTQHGTYEGNNMKEEDYQEWQLQFLDKCYDILSDEGSMFYNHKVRIKNGKMIHPMKWLEKARFTLKQEITWNMKKSANCDKIRFFPFSERIYWMTKSPKTKIYNEQNLSDVWECVPTHKRKETGHIAVMPLQIAENCLSALKENILVLDPFMGTGTTGLGCKIHNNKFIGIDIESDNIEKAKIKLETV